MTDPGPILDTKVQTILFIGICEGLALISHDPQCTAKVDLALEGSTHDLPSPSISALAGLSKQLAKLEIKAQQKAFKQELAGAVMVVFVVVVLVIAILPCGTFTPALPHQ